MKPFSKSNFLDEQWKKISGDLLKYTDDKTEKISSLEKKIFWTSAQFSILNDKSKKRVILMSDFGTGKTTLIKTKAKQLLMEGKEVIFISFEDSETNGDSLLFMALRSEFGNLVYSLRGSGNYESVRNGPRMCLSLNRGFDGSTMSNGPEMFRSNSPIK